MDKVQEMLIKMLKRNPFFKNISDEELLKFSNLFKLGMSNQNEAIIIEWHIPDKIYVAKNWKFIAKKANGLKSVTLWEVEEWKVFGEMSYFYKKPAMASVVCESPSCAYWEISREDFEKFLQENPEIAQQIADELRKREKENQEKLGWNFQIQKNNNDEIEINLD